MDEHKVLYRGEGNSSIVFSSENGKIVYRVFKRSKTTDSYATAAELKEKHERVIRYVRYVIKPLLGSHLITEGELIQLPSEILESMLKIQDFPNLRPEQRLTSCINSAAAFALKLPDVCFIRNGISSNLPLPTITVEIKSKHGFLANDSERRVCRFCLKQNLKKKIGQTKSISQFCPVDLYSGNRSRMKHSLKMLLETPQNNIRIFMDGNLIFSEEKQDREFVSKLSQYFTSSNSHAQSQTDSSVIDSLCDVIIECLLTPYTENAKGHNDLIENHHHPFLSKHSPPKSAGDRNSNHVDENKVKAKCYRETTDVFIDSRETTQQRGVSSSMPHLQHCDNSTFPDCDLEELPAGSVLSRLQVCQLLGVEGINHLYPLYKQLLVAIQHQPYLEEALIHCPYEDYFRSCDHFNDTRLNDIVDKLRRYKIARTFMDACIMVALQPLPRGECEPNDPVASPSHHHVVRDTHGNTFQYQLTVIDLDPKDMSRMEKWKAEEDEINRLAAEAQETTARS